MNIQMYISSGDETTMVGQVFQDSHQSPQYFNLHNVS